MDKYLLTTTTSVAPQSKNLLHEEDGQPEQAVPWVEKYRPKAVNDIVYQDEVVAVLLSILEGGDIPNLLFYGPPGTGKTSAILAAARQLFGNLYRDRVLELNASDERGIQVIREKVKRFAQLSCAGTRSDAVKCPNLKIIILDEADAMTAAAQAALRRTMETEAKTTRFCLICNYISRIIEPLTSRCAKFRFKPLTEEIQLKRLRHIADAETLSIDDDALSALVSVADGDLRRSVTLLQSVARYKGNGIKLEDVVEISGIVPVNLLKDFLSVCKSGPHEKLQNYVQAIILEGHPSYQILTQLFDLLVYDDDFSNRQKSVILEKMAISDKRLIDGAEEYLQLMDIGCCILSEFKKH